MPAPEILARVQFHPSRADVLPRLLNGLAPLPTEIVVDEKHPWSGYQACLRNLPEPVTHVLVIQDDATVCPGFAQVLPRLARDVPVCLFLGAMPMRTRGMALRAIKAGLHWIEIAHADWMPVVAVLWPRAKAESLSAWADAQPAKWRVEKSDDKMAGAWMREHSVGAVACLPSLVEHPDDVPSLTAERRHQRHALWFIGNRDPLEIDWGER